MSWTNHHRVFPTAGTSGALDGVRAFGPSLLEERDGTLRMWYSGHDGSTGRILEAVQEPGQAWQRLGVSVEAEATGASSVESPSVVRAADSYVMAYAGSNGTHTGLQRASSDDGHQWEPEGPLLPEGDSNGLRATHPCLVVTEEGWWLYYSCYDGSKGGRRASIMGAVSTDGVSWDELGPVLSPDAQDLAVSEPAILVRRRHLTMFYLRDDGSRPSIDIATSDDGKTWKRRGTTLRLRQQNHDRSRIRGPAVLRRRDGHLHLWYSARTAHDPAEGCHLWSTEFVKAES